MINMSKLNSLILDEIEVIEELLKLLENQFKFLSSKEVFKLESIVEEIENCSAKIAKLELERRKILEDKTLNELAFSSGNEELEKNYRTMRKLLDEVVVQKDSNEILIKQGIIYSNKMLQVMNPSRSKAKTYGATGKLKK